MADVFRLTKAITGITFSPAGHGSLSILPAGAQLRLTGHSTLLGFVDVTYCDKLYRIFRVDLIERSVTLRTLAAAENGTRFAGPGSSLDDLRVMSLRSESAGEDLCERGTQKEN